MLQNAILTQYGTLYMYNCINMDTKVNQKMDKISQYDAKIYTKDKELRKGRARREYSKTGSMLETMHGAG